MKDLQVSFVYVMYAESPLSKKKDKQAKKKTLKEFQKHTEPKVLYSTLFSYIVNNQAIYILLDFPTLLMNWLTAIIVNK